MTGVWRSMVPAILMLLFSTVAIGWLNYRPLRTDAPTLALFSPWLDARQSMIAATRAGGRIIATSPLLPYGVIVQSDDPAFYDRLKQAGAWLLLDATGRGLCGGIFNNMKRIGGA